MLVKTGAVDAFSVGFVLELFRSGVADIDADPRRTGIDGIPVAERPVGLIATALRQERPQTTVVPIKIHCQLDVFDLERRACQTRVRVEIDLQWNAESEHLVVKIERWDGNIHRQTQYYGGEILAPT